MNVRLVVLAVALFAPPYLTFAQTSNFVVTTQSGRTLYIKSTLNPLQINRIHSWEVEALNSNGTPLENATIVVVGGMPAHDHGLPTQPQASATDRPGVYLVEGIRFHMPGEWEMTFTIQTDNATDIGILEFSL